MPLNPADLQKLQTGVAAAISDRDGLSNAVAAKNADLARTDAEIARLTSSGDLHGAQQQRAARVQLESARSIDIARLSAINDSLRDTIGRLGINIDPCDADPALPLLLLPVRLETRFSADGKQLRVRVYPDDIHIDQLDRGVSDAERKAAIEYWTIAWRGDAASVDTAWRKFIEAVGSNRSAWVITALTPANLKRRLTDPAPAFPDTPARKKHPAAARLLPDAFKVVAIQGGDTASAVGKPIAPSVAVGLFANDGSDLADVAGLKMHPETKWMVDYAEAERIGMAVTVALKKAGTRVDQLFVFGVQRSLDPRTAVPSALRDLLESHRCTRGLAFVTQGTPTNNTETDRSGWQRRIEPRQPERDLAAPDARANSAVLAAAFGLSSDALDNLDNSDAQEQARAASANVAMWNPSWGTFFEKIEHIVDGNSTLPFATREQVRGLHRDVVRGRGPLPALRVGNQPYGVLPVSSVDARWQPAANDDFEARLLSLLRRLRAKWRQCVDNVPRVGKGPIDQAMSEMLGSTAVSAALRVRPVMSYDMMDIAINIIGVGADSALGERQLEQLILRDWGIDADRIYGVGSLGTSTRPLPLPLVHDSDPAFIDGLAKSVPPVKSVFQALIALAWDSAKQDVAKNSAGGRFAEVAVAASTLSATDREHFIAVANRADAMTAGALYAEATRVVTAGGNKPVPSLTELQPIAATRNSFAELSLQSKSSDARAQLSYYGIWAWLHARARFAELQSALQDLKATSLEERRLLIAEALDLASHRLDAWITALVERRRRSLRQTAPTGITVGAYGWVEDIQPTGQRLSDGGYIHAPSLAHAATAGILRNAYLTHNPDAGGSGAFAIDLSSARVRTARQLADGVRQGQPLAALLGYNIERGFHEARLDCFILSLRAIAPLVQGKLTDRKTTLDQAVIEAIAAANVVDGVQLIEKYQGKVTGWNSSRIVTELNKTPANNPYLTGPWAPLTAQEAAAVSSIIAAAADACDAVSDLLLAESVHQLVNGNMARASAALDAASGGDSPVPQADVVVTPGDGMPFTHSIMLIAAGGASWNAERPRATAEPRLEAWAAERLGDPAKIIVAGTPEASPITVAESGLCALDLIYSAGDRNAFMQHLQNALALNLPLARRAALPDDPNRFQDLPLAGWGPQWHTIGDIFELAASLRTVLVSARPLSTLDLVAPNAPGTRTAQPAAIADAVQRATKVTNLLDVRAQALGAVLLALPPNPDDTQRAALAAQLTLRLEPLADFGLNIPKVQGDNLTAIAHLALAEAQRRVAAAQNALQGSPKDEDIIKAGVALFGDGFWILTALGAPAGADVWTAAMASTPAGASRTTIRYYLSDLASVRDNVRRYLEAILLTEAVGIPPLLRAAQIVGAGGTAPSGWIGGTLDPAQPTCTAPVSSAVLDISGNYTAAGDTAGLVIDHWVDVVAVRQRRGKPDDLTAPVDERLTSGVAMNAAAPSARAPQAMLLAVSPDGQRWTSDTVLDTLRDTLDLARIRAVTLERTNGVARVLPALYEQSWSLQGEQALDVRYVAEKALAIDAIAAYVKE